MSEINFIITRREELKALMYECLNEHLRAKAINEKPMTRADLAEFLDVSTVTITDWMKKGLPHKRLNGRVYFIREEVMAAMNSFNTRKRSLIN